MIKEDLRFLLQKFKRPHVGWHDPNFGIRFNDYLDAIEDVVPPDRIDFFAESSLSLLSEPNLKRLKRNGFKAILPGIESWYDMGNKSKTGKKTGRDKVLQVSDHVNLVLKYIPYVQTNFVLGLDVDEGPEPFELTKRFLDAAPGAFPAYSLLTAFGQAASINLDYMRAGRVARVPLSLHEQQPRDERASAELFVGRVLRPSDRPVDLLLLLGDDPAEIPGREGHASPVAALAERASRRFFGRVREKQILQATSRDAGHGPAGAPLLGGRDDRDSSILRGVDQA